MSLIENTDSIEMLSYKVDVLTKKLDNLVSTLVKYPKCLPLSLLVDETGKNRQTLREHLINNYEPDKDFKVENSKIVVNGNVFVAIKEYYDNKNKQKCLYKK